MLVRLGEALTVKRGLPCSWKADENDALVARVLAYGPDPLLSGDLTHDLMPPQTAPVKEVSRKGRLFALALIKKAFAPIPRDRRTASLSMDGEMSIPTAMPRSRWPSRTVRT